MDDNDIPTELTREHVDKCMEMIVNSEIKPKGCMKCSKQFFPNYDDQICDECFFSRFPKDEVKRYYKKIIESFFI